MLMGAVTHCPASVVGVLLCVAVHVVWVFRARVPGACRDLLRVIDCAESPLMEWSGTWG